MIERITRMMEESQVDAVFEIGVGMRRERRKPRAIWYARIAEILKEMGIDWTQAKIMEETEKDGEDLIRCSDTIHYCSWLSK